MRKYYIYAVTLIVLALMLSLGAYFYSKSITVEYRYGTFVELPEPDGKKAA